MKTIIMTIKRRHLRNMALGIKRYELRKTVPRVKDGEKCLVLLCESGSGGEIGSILDFVLARNSSAKVVVNCITSETLAALHDALERLPIRDLQ